MKKDELKIILCQLTSTNSVQKNDFAIKNLISNIKNPMDKDIVSLPENSFFMRTKGAEPVQYLKLDDSTWDFYKNFALKNNLLIHVGATPIEIDNEKFNATVLIKPDGSISAPYKKVHLFDIQLTDKVPMRESDSFKHGIQPHIEDYLGWRLGFTICYDIRFSELYLYYQLNNADLVFIPSAFLTETGKAHWDVLNRARAIEGQYYIVSAAQGGVHSSFRSTYGHSLVVDPWGTITHEIQDTSTSSFLEAVVGKKSVEEVRKQIPMHCHRKLKVEFL